MLKPLLQIALVAALTGCAARFSPQTPTGLDIAIGHLQEAGLADSGTERRAALYLSAAEEASRLLDSPSHSESARLTYNDAVAGLVTLLRDSGQEPRGGRPSMFSDGRKTWRLGYARGGRDGVWDPGYFTSFTRADRIALKNLRRNRRDGVGAALVGYRKTTPPEPQVPWLTGMTAPVTAVLDFKGNAATLTLVNPTEKERMRVAGSTRTLGADFAAPLAAYPRPPELWNGVMGALRVDAHLSKTGLYMLQPYDPDRIPLVFVHGLISTPQMWRGIINELERDPLLRRRYQCWVFGYPTGNPPAYSALRLREELAAARRRHPGMKDCVLVGHSMGGIVSRMQATTFDRSAWDAIGKEKAATLFSKVRKGSLVERACLFRADPHVSRLVFICTPHRGSEMALGHVGSLGRRLIALPVDLTATVTGTMGDTLSILAGQPGRMPNSVTGLSPTNPTLKVLDSQPIRAPFHSIIGDRGKGDSPGSSDGVVKYWSSHLSSSRSECIVPGPHGACAMPETIAELRRILRLHLGADGE